MDYEDGQVYEKLINSSLYYYTRSASGSVGCCYDVIVTYLWSLSWIIIINLQQWSAIRSSETIRHFSHPPGRNGQGFRVALAKSFVTLGTSMIYRKLKLLRNFKKSIQPNKSWEGQGSRNTVKLSFAWILPLLKTILASAIHQINGLKLVDLFTWYRGRPLRQVLSMRDVFEGQLKQRRVPPVAACLLHMMLPLKSCKF